MFYKNMEYSASAGKTIFLLQKECIDSLETFILLKVKITVARALAFSPMWPAFDSGTV